VALAVGLAALALKWWVVRTGRWLESDFDQAWAAARFLLHGQDPYVLIGPEHPYAGQWPFLYPLTTGIAAMPFAALPLAAARLAAAFLWSALFAYGLTRDGWERLPVVLSGSWLFAVEATQWSPLLAAAAMLPALGGLLVAKPTVGAAIGAAYADTFLSRRWRWWVLGVAAFALALSFALVPSWPVEWWATTRVAAHVRAPVTVRWHGVPIGALALLALLRWRRPEARLVAFLACAPQTFWAAETLPLFLVTRTRREAMVLALTTAVGEMIGPSLGRLPSLPAYLDAHRPVLILSAYLPALVMVLRRPNEGEVPAVVERVAAAVRARVPLPRRAMRAAH
jgi:hypothetical protein